MLVRLVIVTVALALATAGASAATWSPPSTLRTCAPARDPQVVFPFSDPSHASGRGAILWLGSPPGCTISGALALDSATLHTSDQPSVARRASDALGLASPLAALSTTSGQLVAAVGAPAGTRLYEGTAGSRLALTGALGPPGSSVAVADGYIGDADVVSTTVVGGRQEIELRAQRHYAHSFSAPVTMLEGAAPIHSLTVALDFRADSIVVWVQGGRLRAQWVSNSGRAGPPQVLGPARYRTPLAAVLSDDNRAFVLWVDQPAPGSDAPSTVYLEHSAGSVTFSAPPRAIATLMQPPAQRLGPAAVSLVRMTPSEGVLAAWPVLMDGDYAIQAAGLTSSRVLPPATISQIGADLRLTELATGPRNDAVAVLERAPRATSGFDSGQQAILAARTIPGGAGGVNFEAPAVLATEGANSAPSVAVDPASDRAVVAWQSVISGEEEIAYAIRGGGP
ncbi:MAG TPA: hypothetical protein VGG41_11345 [Solirubrobacteraceae bacterium]|jgi:hypothetical protein